MILWVVLGIALIVVAFIAVGAVGSRLPKEHSVTRMALFNLPPADVWVAITDFAGQPEWRGDLRNVERMPDYNGRQRWRETDRRGQSMTFETVESISPRRLVRRIIDEDLAFGGSWTMEVGRYGEVTSLTITEDGEVYNPYFRFISKFIIGQTGTIDSYLKSLGKKLGIEVEITSV